MGTAKIAIRNDVKEITVSKIERGFWSAYARRGSVLWNMGFAFPTEQDARMFADVVSKATGVPLQGADVDEEG